jgi:hypothetical protein
MNPTAIAYAIELLGAIPNLIAAGRDIAALVSEGKFKLEQMQAEKRDPTPEEWDVLNAQIKSLRGELHA